MDWAQARENWPALEDSILARWPELDRTEVSAIDGDMPRFVAYLSQTLGIEARTAEEQVAEWLEGPFPADGVMDETMDNARIHQSAAHIPKGEDVYSEDKDFGDDDLKENPVGRTS